MRLIPAFRSRTGSKRPRPSADKRRRYLMAAALITLTASGASAWYGVASGWFTTQADRAYAGLIRSSADAGLVVREVLVSGRHETSRKDLLAALRVTRGQPILVVDTEQARRRVEALGWVKSAAVARRLPDIVYLQITEREPLALWQHNGRHALIDRDGEVIQRRKLERFAKLPLIVGADAPAHAAQLIDMLRPYPELTGEITAAVRVSQRRWNLRLRNGIDVRLPETNLSMALVRLAEFQREHKLFDRDVVAVDLRVPDRLIVQVHGKATGRIDAAGENT